MSALRPEDTINDLPSMVPEVSTLRVAKASWDNVGILGTATSAITEGIKREGYAQQGTKLPPKQINAMYKDLNADRPVTIAEAEHIMSLRKRQQENDKVIALASDSFLKGTALPFVAGAARAMTDPIDLGIGMITGGIGTGLAKGSGIAKKVAIDAIEAAAAATIAEAPVAVESDENFQEYTAQQYLQNVVLASAMQIGITYGGKAAYKSVAKTLEFAGDKTANGILKVAEELEAQGYKSDGFSNTAIKKLQESVENVESVNYAVKEATGGKVELGEDVSTTIKNLQKAHEEGKITNEELIEFKRIAEDTGINPSLVNRVVDDQAYKFDENESKQILDSIERAKNESNYDPNIEEKAQDLDSFNSDKVLEDNIAVLEQNLKDYEPELEDITFFDEDGNGFKAKDIKADLDKNTAELKAFEEFAKCSRGA